jgi:Flp pilus assembly protein TadG
MLNSKKRRLVVGLRAHRLLAMRAMRRLARKQDGSAAIEFGFVAAPFIAMLFAIIQAAFVFFATSALEAVTAQSARLVLTGQAQGLGLTAATFHDQVCANIAGIFDCNKILVDVQVYASFSASTPTLPVDPATGKVATNFQFNPGKPGDIVTVRIMYQIPLYMSLFCVNCMGNMAMDANGTNQRLLMATAVFKNEPFNP